MSRVALKPATDIEDMFLLETVVRKQTKVEECREFLESIGEDVSEYSDKYIQELVEEGF